MDGSSLRPHPPSTAVLIQPQLFLDTDADYVAAHRELLVLIAQSLSDQHLLDLLDFLALSLRHHHDDEKRAQRAHGSEQQEGLTGAQQVDHGLEQLGDGERQGPVEGRRDGAGRTLELGGEQFADHHPGYGTESYREHDDVDRDASQRNHRQGGVVLSEDEVDAEGGQTEGHHEARGDQEDLAAGSVDQEGRHVGGCHLEITWALTIAFLSTNAYLNYPDDNGAQTRGHGASGGGEYGSGVKQHGVDSAELLEEHEGQGDDEGLAGSPVGHQVG